jgi:DNA replication protein DnaC
MEGKKDFESDSFFDDLEPKYREGRKGSDQSDFFKKLVASRLLNLEENTVVTKYGLEPIDLKIVTFLIQNSFEGRKCISTRSILESIANEINDCLKGIERLWKLEEKSILACELKVDINILDHLDANWRINDSFLNKLFPISQSIEQNIEPYESNEEYIRDQFRRVKFLRDLRLYDTERQCKFNVQSLDQEIVRRLEKTVIPIPFESIKQRYQLKKEEDVCLLALLHPEKGEKEIDYYVLEEMIKRYTNKKRSTEVLDYRNGTLFKEKLIEMETRINPERKTIQYLFKLNESLASKILGTDEAEIGSDSKSQDIGFFEMSAPKIPMDSVILENKTRDQIKAVIEMYCGDVSSRLLSWGFQFQHRSQYKETSSQTPTMTMIFYGPPGTGKSLCARMIASELDREIIEFDCSSILDAWVGESQKNVKKIFTKYRELSQKMKNPPVLLLNEADQFLHRRVSAIRSSDQMRNQMLTIFLEQLEQFEGILIATTNIIENLDSAFSRRFDCKIPFKRPGIEERNKLWKSLIPQEAPLANNVDFGSLGRAYDLSGGQIELVIKQAAINAARRNSPLNQDDFISACEEELTGNFDEKARKIVGF